MPNSCRILNFPSRRLAEPLSPKECASVASSYLKAATGERDVDSVLDPDVLMAVCAELRAKVEVNPSHVFEESARLFEVLNSTARPLGVFDEREYLLGELSLLSARSGRHLGKKEETERWLDRSESYFRLTVNPAPHLANTAYVRLALRYEMRRFDEVLEQAPILAKTFERLEMVSESAKTTFMQSVTLKVIGRRAEAYRLALSLAESVALRDYPALLGQVWGEIGEHQASGGQFQSAIESFQRAVPLLQEANRPLALFSLKLSLGEVLRNQGHLAQATDSFRSANEDARALGMPTYVAYSHVLTSEALLSQGRNREAEWEIYAALPLLQEHSMVPEGLAALTVLKESLQRRKADSGALRSVREYLQAN